MNTWRKVALRHEDEIFNAGVPPCGDQVPLLEEDVIDDQAPVDPSLMDDAIGIALYQMS